MHMSRVSCCCLFLILVFLKGTKDKGKAGKELPQTTSKAGSKRRKDVGGDQHSKVAKAEGDVSTSRATRTKNANDLESKLEAQIKELWMLKDDLKKHVTTSELRKMLEVNGQDTTGSELDLRDRW